MSKKGDYKLSNATAVFVANRGYALISSRKEIIKYFIKQGWEIVIATSEDLEAEALCKLGAKLEVVKFNRGGFSPKADFYAYKRLLAIYHKWQPSLVQHFHAKPVILGSLAARKVLGKKVSIVNAITGLGHAFIKGGLTAKLAGLGYKLSLFRSDCVIFQNKDDQELFITKGWVGQSQAKYIPSSGINTEQFKFVDRQACPAHKFTILMLGRLLNQKGIPEFIDIAEKIKKLYPESQFLWAGEEDPMHPDAVAATWLHKQPNVKYLGRVGDVHSLLAKADIMLFPSYREGFPRAVLEAAATGLPVVGFDVPGVREAIKDGESGFLVPYKDIHTMFMRVNELLSDPVLRKRMGRSARKRVEAEFDKQFIHKQYLKVYEGLGADF